MTRPAMFAAGAVACSLLSGCQPAAQKSEAPDLTGAPRILAASDPALQEAMVAFQADLKKAAQDKGAVVRGDTGARRLGF